MTPSISLLRPLRYGLLLGAGLFCFWLAIPDDVLAQDDPRVGRAARTRERLQKAREAREARRAEAAKKRADRKEDSKLPPLPARPPTVRDKPTTTTGPATPGRPGASTDAPTTVTVSDFQCRQIPADALVDVKLKPNSELNDLVGWIMGITCRHFIISEKIRAGRITLLSPQRISAGEAYRAFLSSLDVMGLTLEPSGTSLKIVEKDRAKERAIPTYGSAEGAPRDDRVITKLIKLKHVPADDIANVLKTFKDKAADHTVYPQTNTLIMTDTASNIDRLSKIIRELDVEKGSDKIYAVRVHHALASELADKLLLVLEQKAAGSTGGSRPGTTSSTSRTTGAGARPAGSAAAGNIGAGAYGDTHLTKIVPDDRTQQLLIISNETGYLRIHELLKKVDIPLESGAGKIHVLHLENSNAEELAQTLQALIGGTGAPGAAPRPAGAAGAAARPPGSAARPGGSSAPLQLFEGEVRVTPDKPSNSLVVVANTSDYISLRGVIRKLDIPRRQVFVEAVIMEVSLDKTRNLGLAGHAGYNADGSIIFGGTIYPGPPSLSSLVLNPTALQGLAAGVRGPEIPGSQQIFGAGVSIPAFGVLLQALQTNNDVNVLSTPHILTTDNQEATILVGQNLPFQGGFTGLPGAAGAAGAASFAPVVSVQRQDVALKLTITPHVNDSDFVRLEINQEVSDIVSENFNGLGPATSKRMAKTQVVVRDQQTVVIGGLVSDRVRLSVQKVPLLGDIPVLGWLFKTERKSIQKTNLLIVMTSYIIKDISDFRRIFEKKMEERRDFIERYTAFKHEDIEAEIDYKRKRGLLEEINQTAREVDAEYASIQEAARKLASEHQPVTPLDLPKGPVSGTGRGGRPSGASGGAAPAAAPKRPTIAPRRIP